MARIKLGPLATDIAGSIGGATIQRNRFGYTIRSKPLPLKSETPAQYTVRRLIIHLQYSWQGLSDAVRLQWNRFPNFSGQTIRRDRSVLISGQSLFIMYNLYLLLNDQAILTPISYAPLPDFPTFEELGWDGEFLYASFTGVINPATLFFILKLSHPKPARFRFNPSGLLFMKPTWESTADFDIADSYLAAFGAIPPDLSYLSYSVRFFSTISPIVSGVFTGVIPCLHE